MFNSGLSTSHALFEINKKLKNYKILKIVDGGIEKGSDIINIRSRFSSNWKTSNIWFRVNAAKVFLQFLKF